VFIKFKKFLLVSKPSIDPCSLYSIGDPAGSDEQDQIVLDAPRHVDYLVFGLSPIPF
jgi:hypothetical protein